MKINPLYISINQKMTGPFFSIFVRNDTENLGELQDYCNDLSAELFPDFRISFNLQEDKIKALYQQEAKIFQMIGKATVLILVISCTGK